MTNDGQHFSNDLSDVILFSGGKTSIILYVWKHWILQFFRFESFCLSLEPTQNVEFTSTSITAFCLGHTGAGA